MSREDAVFFNDQFWKCFQQDVDPEKEGYERDEERGGWWVPKKALYKEKPYEEPKDHISEGGLAK